MTAYWMARVKVTDEASYGEYAKRAGPAIEKHGGRFLARGGRFITLEGGEYPRNVLVEFPSVDAAEACYNSPEYQEAVRFAEGAADRLLVIVEGV
ncbi:MAG: DUF1330 domain-containing protein [Rhodospirillales bacterium]|nr:MAG: DUF1330 domain-containing protein [Rhodospirillales bacterium]